MILLGLLIPVAFGRWGSYISPFGGLVYLSDLLVGAGLVVAAFEAMRDRRRAWLPGLPRMGFLAAATLSVCAIGLARAVPAPELVVRDLVPVVYFLVIPIGVWAVRTMGAPAAFLWVRRALAIHTVWLLAVLVGVLPTVDAPFVGIPAFTTRLDMDMLLLGAAIAAYGLDRRPRPAVRAAMIGASAVALVLAGSRAGLISAVALLIVTFLVARPLRGSRLGPLLVGVGLIGVVNLLAALPVLLSAPPAWATAFVRLIPNDDQAYTSALNTWDARVEAWRLLVDYTREEPVRWLFGSGFGSSPVIESGAIDHLSGDPSVRAAHSFIVTWIAYVGVVGTLLLVGVLVFVFAVALRNAAAPSAPVALGLGMMTGILLTASAGVIFESPFGYQPFVIATALALLRPEDLPGPHGLGGDIGASGALEDAGQSPWRSAHEPATLHMHGLTGRVSHQWTHVDTSAQRGRDG